VGFNTFELSRLAGELRRVHEPFTQLLQMERLKIKKSCCVGKFPDASARNATSSCSFVVILRELNTALA